MERRAEAMRADEDARGTGSRVSSGSAPAVADSRGGVAAGRARAPPPRRLARVAGAVAAGPTRAARAARRLGTRGTVRILGSFKGERATRARSARRGGTTTYLRVHASRSRPLPIVDVVRGVVRVRSPTRRARVCLRGAGPHTLGTKKTPPVMTFSPRGKPVCIFLTHRSNYHRLVGHAAGRHYW